jgi:hypothetical protein
VECQPRSTTFFFKVFLKSDLPVLRAIFASTQGRRWAGFPKTEGAMLAAALAAEAPSQVVLRREYHQPLLIEIEVSGLQGLRFRFHSAKVRGKGIAGKVCFLFRSVLLQFPAVVGVPWGQLPKPPFHW